MGVFGGALCFMEGDLSAASPYLLGPPHGQTRGASVQARGAGRGVSFPEGDAGKEREEELPSVACAIVGHSGEEERVHTIKCSSCATGNSGDAAGLHAVESSNSASLVLRDSNSEGLGGSGGSGASGAGRSRSSGEATERGDSTESTSVLAVPSDRHSERCAHGGSNSSSSSSGEATGQDAIEPSSASLVPSGGREECGGGSSGGVIGNSLACQSCEGAFLTACSLLDLIIASH